MQDAFDGHQRLLHVRIVTAQAPNFGCTHTDQRFRTGTAFAVRIHHPHATSPRHAHRRVEVTATAGGSVGASHDTVPAVGGRSAAVDSFQPAAADQPALLTNLRRSARSSFCATAIGFQFRRNFGSATGSTLPPVGTASCRAGTRRRAPSPRNAHRRGNVTTPAPGCSVGNPRHRPALRRRGQRDNRHSALRHGRAAQKIDLSADPAIRRRPIESAQNLTRRVPLRSPKLIATMRSFCAITIG